MSTHLHALFDFNAVVSFDKQLHLADAVGALDWNVDLKKGLLSFQDRHSWRFHVLGTESAQAGSWLWAWANTASNIPPTLLESSLQLRQFGKEHGIPEFAEAQVSLDQVDGHTIALIASGICEANAYYRAPYDGGAAFLLIKDENFPKHVVENPLARIATVFPQVISAVDIHNHKLAFASYVAHYGFEHAEEGNQVLVIDKAGKVMTATFDDHNRLTNLQVTIRDDKTAAT